MRVPIRTYYGDVWWVWIVTDRIPVGIGIVLLYFGFRVKTFWMGIFFFGSLSLPLLLTIPRRYGLAIAITYLIEGDGRTRRTTFLVVRLTDACGKRGKVPIQPP